MSVVVFLFYFSPQNKSLQCQKTALRFLCAELETHLQVWELFSLGFSSSSGDGFTMQTNGP